MGHSKLYHVTKRYTFLPLYIQSLARISFNLAFATWDKKIDFKKGSGKNPERRTSKRLARKKDGKTRKVEKGNTSHNPLAISFNEEEEMEVPLVTKETKVSPVLDPNYMQYLEETLEVYERTRMTLEDIWYLEHPYKPPFRNLPLQLNLRRF